MDSLVAASTAPTAELLMPLLWVFGVATVIVAILHLKKVPSLLGFLLTGVLVGPAGFGVVRDADAIAIMAEIGVVLLLFTIGLEVSLRDLARMAKLVLGGGLFQIASTTCVFTGLAWLTGVEIYSAVGIGLMVSASSTALVLRLLGDRGELGTPYGRLALAILLAQDFAVVGLMLVLPMLATRDIAPFDLAVGLGEAVLVAAVIYVGARFAFPWLLEKIVALRSREIFLLTTMAVLFGTAMAADALGLSLALGAFVAGLVVSESEFSHQMFAEVLPFRDVFNGLFFASVGLMIDPVAVTENLGLLAAFIAVIIVAKFIIIFLTARLMSLSLIPTLLASFALFQVGEFGLILAQQGALLELITPTQHSLIIAVAVFTMALTPIIYPFAAKKIDLVRQPGEGDVSDVHGPLKNHVIIVGYGLNGQNVARALKQLEVPLVVVDLNKNTVDDHRKDDVLLVFGDATRPALLEHLNIDSAKALVSAIADAPATREIVSNARHANPDLLIIARTRYVAEIEPLQKIGANVVVPEEYETSIELVGQVMQAYGASEAAIQREKRQLRSERYKVLLEEPEEVNTRAIDDLLYALEVERIEVTGDAIAGKSIAESDFRSETGSTIVAVLRDNETHSAPEPGFVVERGDMLVVVGDCEGVTSARRLADS